VFTAVSFYDDFAFVVTFFQTDPFYVVEFQNDGSPKAIGELKVTGFSRYLYPIDSDQNLLIGLGREADENGRDIGMQLSLFDVEKRDNPTLVARLVMESGNGWTSTSADWDPKAFRYLKLDEKRGRLIIPITSGGSDRSSYFDGFTVFKIDASLGERAISWEGDISHAPTEENADMCYSCGYLPERSFVISGNVYTIKGHSALSHDLDTFEELWRLDFTSDECCYWY
jgi:hypothetical protein